MKIFIDEYTNEYHKYVAVDADGKSYYIQDSIKNFLIADTIVVHADSYDEVEDSELFKRLLGARAQLSYYNQIVDLVLAQKKGDI
jgi:translation elongation factor EF-1alpha